MIAPNSIVSRNTMVPVVATIRRTPRGYAGPRRIGLRHRASGRDHRNAPSRSRRRPAHPIDLRRSDCRAGEPSTFGAPCSVHSETYWHIWWPSSTLSSESVANCDNPLLSSNSIWNSGPDRSAPRRWLPRPTSQLTAAEATACRRAINLRRSVLGAHGTLRPRTHAVKSEPIAKSAVCEFFFISSTTLRLDACALAKRDQGFAEPGALSSTSPADLPLPRTASREGFVLVASRARRSGNLRLTRGPRKGICRRKPRNLRTRGVR